MKHRVVLIEAVEDLDRLQSYSRRAIPCTHTNKTVVQNGMVKQGLAAGSNPTKIAKSEVDKVKKTNKKTRSPVVRPLQ